MGIPSKVEVRNYIHDDIVFSILSKLPIKSLKRFECVCKSFSYLFDNPYFMTMYRNHFLSKDYNDNDNTSVLVLTTPDNGATYYNYKNILYSFSDDKMVKLDWPKPFPEYEPPPFQEGDFDEYDSPFPVIRFMILGSVTGIVCLECFKHGEIHLILWNPTTKEFKFVPYSPIESEPYWDLHLDNSRIRVGYDRVKHDYKMIRFVYCYPQPDLPPFFFWEVYSLNSNSWKKMSVDDMPCSYYNTYVYMEGVSHWWNKNENNSYLVSFDFTDESFITTPIPSHVDDSMVGRHLVLLNGSIALILNNRMSSTIHISILCELGIEESWTKLFIVGFLPDLEYLIIGTSKKNKILFRKKDGELVWFDLRNEIIEETGIVTTYCYCKTVFHTESILSIGGIDN